LRVTAWNAFRRRKAAEVRPTNTTAHIDELYGFEVERLPANDFTLDKVLLLTHGRRTAMLYYALIFLVIGLIAGVLGISGVAAVASQIAWVLFLIGIILLVVHLVTGNRQRSVL
jgi:uncharacterized membrane protein YtjA (UPF0391 family)